MANSKHLCDADSHRIVAGVLVHLAEDRINDAFETVSLYLKDMMDIGYDSGEIFHSLFRASLRVTMNVAGDNTEVWNKYAMTLATIEADSDGS